MKRSLPLILALLLSACSPKYDWRDYRSNDAPYAVLFPGKPATQTRSIKLDQLDVSMTMSAADIDGVVFAVGSAQLADATQAPAAVEAMKTAMVKNINATVTSSKTLDNGALEVDASGTEKGQTMRLIGRFIAKEKRIYQVVVVGPARRIDADSVDTFLTSFKQN
ncbi:hypothetical protein FHW83_005245 [Duganella sp. SG902]|uniref:hypothetical protein n=1 Tax=Duganella sp. SG902 TaxID=2587016 RepID=UPI00159EB142|nr:hypothetical protein [Duganella sp. SG902]NVM79406.1 hypothetical protein [Duganella sp. SG902]